MQVLIRLYASYREQAGVSRINISLREGSVVADAVEELVKTIPALPASFHPHLIAVNEELANF